MSDARHSCETDNANGAAVRQDSLEKLLEIVDTANQKGILKMLGYLVDDADDLVDAGIKSLATPSVFELLAKLGTLMEAGKEVNVAPMPSAVHGINGFVEGFVNRDEDIRVRNVFDLLTLLKDPDIRLALSAIFSGLKGMGQKLQERA